MIHEWQQRRVLVTHRFPIDAVHRRREEEVAHLSPALEIDLAPLSTAVQLHVESLDLMLVILGLNLIFGNVDDGVVFFDLHQHLFSVERNLVIVGVAEHGFLAVVEIISAEVRFLVFLLEQLFVILAHFISGCATQIEDSAVIKHADIAIVTGRNLQTNDPILDSVGINFHYNRLFRFLFRLFLARACLRFFLFGLLSFFFFSLFRGLADFIAFWRERIGSFFRQRNEINALHIAIDVRKFLIAKSWFEIARGGEQQIFSVIAEDRFARAVPAVGNGGLLFVREGV